MSGKTLNRTALILLITGATILLLVNVVLPLALDRLFGSLERAHAATLDEARENQEFVRIASVNLNTLPQDAVDLHTSCDNARDSSYCFEFTASPAGVERFVRQRTEMAIDALATTPGGHPMPISGFTRDPWHLRNGRYYDKGMSAIAVDLDHNRVVVCSWTM